MIKSRNYRIVVAGQFPPPVTGQNLMIKRIFQILTYHPDLSVAHLPLRFSQSISEIGRVSPRKVLPLLEVYVRLIKLRFGGKIDGLLYPVGGPRWVPIIRDFLILPFCVIFSHNVILYYHAGGLADRFAGMNLPLRWLVRRLYSLAASAVVLTEFGRKDALILGIKNIVVIPNPVKDTCNQSLIQSYRNNRPTILNVGLQCVEKGTTALVGAFAKIHRDFPEARLVLVGEFASNSYRDEIRNLISSLGISGSVVITGLLFGEEKWENYATADIFVFPSLWAVESFGLVLVEAMMWALPVVVVDWRANAEIIGSDPGGACFQLNTDLTSDLVQALRKVLQERNLWQKWGRQNRNRYLKCYEESKVSRKLCEKLLDLIVEA